MNERNDPLVSAAVVSISDQPDMNALKLLAFVSIGYLHCIREGVCHPDEVYRVIGQPRILENLEEVGASEKIIDLINGLDEPAWARERMGFAWFENAVAELLREAEEVVRALGPPDDRSAPPTLAMIGKTR